MIFLFIYLFIFYKGANDLNNNEDDPMSQLTQLNEGVERLEKRKSSRPPKLPTKGKVCNPKPEVSFAICVKIV